MSNPNNIHKGDSNLKDIQKPDSSPLVKIYPAKKFSKRNFLKSFLLATPFLIQFFLLNLPIKLKSQLVNTSVTNDVLTIETLPDLETHKIIIESKNYICKIFF